MVEEEGGSLCESEAGVAEPVVYEEDAEELFELGEVDGLELGVSAHFLHVCVVGWRIGWGFCVLSYAGRIPDQSDITLNNYLLHSMAVHHTHDVSISPLNHTIQSVDNFPLLTSAIKHTQSSHQYVGPLLFAPSARPQKRSIIAMIGVTSMTISYVRNDDA